MSAKRQRARGPKTDLQAHANSNGENPTKTKREANQKQIKTPKQKKYLQNAHGGNSGQSVSMRSRKFSSVGASLTTHLSTNGQCRRTNMMLI